MDVYSRRCWVVCYKRFFSLIGWKGNDEKGGEENKKNKYKCKHDKCSKGWRFSKILGGEEEQRRETEKKTEEKLFWYGMI